MNIEEIAKTINEKSKDYQMSSFPQIRKNLHSHVTKSPPSDIFTYHTIKDDYAFHFGGRKELQFNIGFIEEKGRELFRYGVALSFEENQTLPDFRVLEKRFIRFNEFIKANKSKLLDYKLYFHDVERVFISVDELDKGLFRESVFIFLGKMTPSDEIDYNEVLTTFDQLLEAYIYVEGNEELHEIDTTTDGKFKFEPKFSERVEKALRKPPANKVAVDLRHNQIQGKIYHILIGKYGKKYVGTENNTGFGTSIDIVVKHNSEFIFYEIKTNSSIRLCLREALGQLIEYTYWSKKKIPDKLIIISENPITDQASDFLQTLRKELNLNVYYQQFDFDNNKLSKQY